MKRFALSAVERYVYTPYGEVLVNQETSFGDRDGDNDVDATDKGTVGVTCTGTVSGSCRILDLDFDGDYDGTDATAFDALTQGLARHPGRTSTAVSQPFAHQGLLFEPEIGSYQNRARQYDPGKRRFMQRDPLRKTGRTHLPYDLASFLSPQASRQFRPNSAVDPLGTIAGGVFLCNRPADLIPGTNHAYLWDAGTEQSCSRDAISSGSSGDDNEENNGYPGRPENGAYDPISNPGGDCCIEVPNSAGREQAIMLCCKEHANDGPWIPYLNDCQYSPMRCMGAAGGNGSSPPPPPGDYPEPPGGHHGEVCGTSECPNPCN